MPQTLSRRQLCQHALAAGLALVAPLGAGATSTTTADSAEALRASIDVIIQPLMARYDIPGMAVALSIEGRAQVFNYGVRARDSQAPVNDATIFEIGSVSKMFTATLAAYAEASGKLALRDHPGRYVAALKGSAIDKASLLHLGSYTAGGLPLQFPDGVKDDADALAYLQRWKPAARPGSQRLYSNPSIGLLGAATAAAMQGRFALLMEKQIFAPLGMRHSHLHVPAEAMADYAWGHRQGRQVRVNPGPMDEATYGIKTTAADLLRFVQAQLDPAALDAPLRRAVETTQIGQFRVGHMVQGFGWEQFPYPLSRELLLGGNAEEIYFDPNPVQAVPAQPASTPRLFNKTGSTGGFGAYVLFVPAKRIGIVILANRSYPIPARVEAGYAILESLAPSPQD
ncbi:class C beta-lactamase [Roseateles aquae]